MLGISRDRIDSLIEEAGLDDLSLEPNQDP